MLFTSIASAVVLAASVVAQTPVGFVPAANKTLDVYFGTTYITPGLMIKKSYIDVPGQGSTKRTTVLHALLQDYTPGSTIQNGTSVLTTKATGPSSYFGPAPPAETPKHPHNYVFLLHEQPANFAVPSSQRSVVQSRMGIDWVKFMADAGLSAPLFANYMQVQSGDNTIRGLDRLFE
ncbi:hypothetical protein P154DRAFT_538957 [Amniculicola lignicola CBS 123094]|uniref:PEBP-like protein n=1 Tax=Amniculicola lignicola CBS 123094 TaxID=1392246 RepID=A0A6A5WBZ6_9PLEO|nr:hypothetical protein P154DRAFT_538957 [Amniculicola lignicola CBS 123094]